MKQLSPTPRAVDGVHAPPLLARLLELFEQRWDGTLLVRDDRGRLLAALYVQGGIAVAGRARGSSPELAQRLAPLCARMDCRFEQADGVNLLSAGPDVATGAVAPAALAWEVIRSALCDDLVDDAIADLGQRVLELRPGADLSRYGFEAEEREAVAALAHVPVGFDQLLEDAPVPEPVLRRLVYTLLVTRSITVSPRWPRATSGSVVREDTPTVRPPRPDDEPTAVVALRAGSRRTRLEGSRKQPNNATQLEYRRSSSDVRSPSPGVRSSLPSVRSTLPGVRSSSPGARSSLPSVRSTLPGVRASRPAGSAPAPADPYRVHRPEHGEESIAPSTRAQSVNRTICSNPAPVDRSLEADAEMYFKAAELLWRRGDCRRAVLAAQKAIRLAPPRPERLALYAWLLYQRSGAGSSVPPHVWEHLDRALLADPDCAVAHRYMGVLLGRIGEIEQARYHLSRAAEIDASDTEAARELELIERAASKA